MPDIDYVKGSIEMWLAMKQENTRLKTLIAELRFFSFLKHLASVTHRSAGVLQKSLNNLELTETFMRVCKEDSPGWMWTNEGGLYFMSPFAEQGAYKPLNDVEDFYTILQILKEEK